MLVAFLVAATRSFSCVAARQLVRVDRCGARALKSEFLSHRQARMVTLINAAERLTLLVYVPTGTRPARRWGIFNGFNDPRPWICVATVLASSMAWSVGTLLLPALQIDVAGMAASALTFWLRLHFFPPVLGSLAGDARLFSRLKAYAMAAMLFLCYPDSIRPSGPRREGKGNYS